MSAILSARIVSIRARSCSSFVALAEHKALVSSLYWYKMVAVCYFVWLDCSQAGWQIKIQVLVILYPAACKYCLVFNAIHQVMLVEAPVSQSA